MSTEIEKFQTEFMDAALGLTAWQTTKIVGSFTSGINWCGYSKGSMAEDIADGVCRFLPSTRKQLIQKLKRAKRKIVPKKKKRRKAKKKATTKKKAKAQKKSAHRPRR